MSRHEVLATHRKWRDAFADAHKMAAGQKRRGRGNYKHYVRAIRQHGQVAGWRITREVTR